MKKGLVYSMLFLAVLAIYSCGHEMPESENSLPAKALKHEVELDAKMVVIDTLIERVGLTANSLAYSKENGESVKVNAYLSENHEILKMEEVYSKPDNGGNGSTVFYLNGKYPLVSIEKFEDYTNPAAPKFVEKISYYDGNGKVLSTKARSAKFEEELEGAVFVVEDKKEVSPQRAFDILNQKGEFETTFQGFVESEPLDYMIVGEPKQDGYTSALRIEFQDPFIGEAFKEQKKYINRKIRVSFQSGNLNGYQYQIYTGANWAD